MKLKLLILGLLLCAVASAQNILFIPNDPTTGTKSNRLAVLNSTGQAVVAATTDTTGILGIVAQGAGKTGSAFISQSGFASCDFDGPTTAKDYVVASTTAPALCHDAGSSQPAGVSIVGRVATTGGTSVLVFSMGGAAISNGGGAVDSVFGRAGVVVGLFADYSAFYDAAGAAATAQTAAITAAATHSDNASNLSGGTIPAARLPATAVTPGSYTNLSATVDASGRITSASNGTGGSTDASTLTSGTLPAARLPTTAVTAGSYTSGNFTVDAAGRLTAASNGTGGGGVASGTLASRPACSAPAVYVVTDHATSRMALDVCDGTNWQTVLTVDATLVITNGVLSVDLTKFPTLSAANDMKATQILEAGYKIAPVLVSALPAATTGAGTVRTVSDALSPTAGSTIAGVGTLFRPVISDGTNWKSLY